MRVGTILEEGKYTGEIDTLSGPVTVVATITEIIYRNGNRFYFWDLHNVNGEYYGSFASANPSDYTFPKYPNLIQ